MFSSDTESEYAYEVFVQTGNFYHSQFTSPPTRPNIHSHRQCLSSVLMDGFDVD